ncbi:MAG: hypothetical protein WA949_16700 [Phormidesmis sp.]
MRTTITLDDDVAASLKQLKGFSSFKEAVNATLRAGLNTLQSPSRKTQTPYRVKPVKLGIKVKNVDNIAEILELIEGD